jgi:hypothetical protein
VAGCGHSSRAVRSGAGCSSHVVSVVLYIARVAALIKVWRQAGHSTVTCTPAIARIWRIGR